MKKYLVILLILITGTMSAFAANTKEILSTVENSLFGYEYKNESDSKRLDRLEEHLYGEKRTGTVQKRLESIQTDSGIVVVEQKPVNVQKDNVADNKERTQNLKEDATVDYPIVDEMEKEIFHTTYKNENIYNRLNRLEEKVFTKTSNADLNTRVDKLATVLKPKMTNQNTYTSNYTAEQMDRYYNDNGFEQVNNQTIPFQLLALEEELLKKSYSNDNNSNRLGRLEQKLFNRTFPNDSDATRMQRIKVAYDAKQNSYKYENNRKMQNMATMSQLGGILLMILAILL
ncbi:hypothetical protein IJ182_08565 [bacterium]|nr:hypothetical protein [bacterium]